ncbi:MAG: hypothetical protein ABFQ95_02510 [Pseudomonadota bacterium]
MKRLYFLSAVLVVQVFCFAGDGCLAHTKDLSGQMELGKNLLTPVDNAH